MLDTSAAFNTDQISARYRSPNHQRAHMFFAAIRTLLDMRDSTTFTTNRSPQNSASSDLVTIAKFASPPHDHAEIVLTRFYAQSLARELLPRERVAKCLRAIIPGKRTVEVIHDPKRQRAQYKNLITCGLLWLCNVCATRITERRAAELLIGVTKWQQESGFIALLTYTVRHNANDSLDTLLQAVRDAHRDFKNGAPWQRFQERYSWHGSVTALEVTHGDHGWHPHLHELVFFHPLGDEKWRAFPDAAKTRWIAALQAQGRDATWTHGLDVRDADSDVYDYVAKYGRLPSGTRWTIEREVAKAPSKKASRDGSTPWQLLMKYGDGDASAGKLFQEYASAFKNRKQLVWSRGLRAELGLNAKEPTDDEIAAELPEEYALLVELQPRQWQRLMELDRDVRGELLAIASAGNRAELVKFLEKHFVYVGVGQDAEA